MRKTKRNRKDSGNKNIRLGLYFGLVVVFIIIISFTFKVFDSIKKSTFDSSKFYTVVVLSEKNTQLISASPKDNSLKKITLEGLDSEAELRNLGIPFDMLGQTDSEESISPKTYFTKLLLHQNKLKSDLTIFDLIKLSIYSNKVGSSSVVEKSLSAKEENIEDVLSDWFLDPEIVKEEKK